MNGNQDRTRNEARHRLLDARLGALAGRGVVADVLRPTDRHFSLTEYDYLGREIGLDGDIELELEIELDEFEYEALFDDDDEYDDYDHYERDRYELSDVEEDDEIDDETVGDNDDSLGRRSPGSDKQTASPDAGRCGEGTGKGGKQRRSH
jgi:hypothetical protein